MEPTPPSKRRRSSSPAPHRPSASPSRPVLPPPTPSAHAPPGLYPSFAAPPPSSIAGPSWQSWSSERDDRMRLGEQRERDRDRDRDRDRETDYRDRDRISRRSMEIRSPFSDVDSTRMEGIDEGSEGGMVFTRDNGGRAPRSMMACTRCRRQKMKCDGPGVMPCRGCRQSGQPCIFEARSRPKSISALPSRAPPFYPSPSGLGRPGSPTPMPSVGPSGSSGFYPSHSQPAPPVTSRTHPPTESYMVRSAREPLPPAPPSSLSAIASSSYAMRGHSPSASMSALPTAPPASSYYNPPVQLQPIVTRPPSPMEMRWRQIESSLRSLQGLSSTIDGIQSSLTHLQRSSDAIYSTVSTRASSAQPSQIAQPVHVLQTPTAHSAHTINRETKARDIIPEISDEAWKSYRSSAWPLTPWLVGLREPSGLPGLVVMFLGRRTLMNGSEQSRRECEDSSVMVHAEIGRLMSERLDWTREETRALGVFATWNNDSALACLAVGQARMQGLDKILSPKRSHDDWREWIYLSLMDKLSHVSDFIRPVSNDTLSHAWRDRLNAVSAADPAVRDRDLKLLAWLEYAEYLLETLKAQHTARLASDEESQPQSSAESGPKRPDSAIQRNTGEEKVEGPGRRAIMIWRKWGPRWETWSTTWNVRTDPILALHFNYATLFTASPVFLTSATVWADLASIHEGFQNLERARDAAFAVVQAICSPEVARTLPFSFGLFRPLLGLALHTLISLHIALPNSPIISPTHLTSVLRSTYDAIHTAQPLDAGPLTQAVQSTQAAHMRSPTVATGALAGRGSVERSMRPGSRASRLSFNMAAADRLSTASGASGSGGLPAGALGLGGMVPEGGLLREMVEGGMAKGKDLLGMEPGRDVWRRLIG